MLAVLNDIHIGASRSAGTTPTTQWELRKYLLQSFGFTVGNVKCDLLINGDLFDTNNIAVYDVLKTFEILSIWCSGQHGTLYLLAGNHDLSKSNNVLSSFEFLCRMLEMTHKNVVIIKDAGVLTPHGYMIPHVPNQALFDLELSKVPECDYLFLHCNYDNNFAAQADQSLNLSKEQADALPVKRIILGHEHHARGSGKVIVPGNQFASSVADWQSTRDKYWLLIDGETVTWNVAQTRDREYIEMDWREAKVTDHRFVRIAGTATPEEGTAAIAAINNLRKRHTAFVITNAIRISTEDTDTAQFEQSLEKVQGFSVWSALETLFSEDHMKKLHDVAEKAKLC